MSTTSLWPRLTRVWTESLVISPSTEHLKRYSDMVLIRGMGMIYPLRQKRSKVTGSSYNTISLLEKQDKFWSENKLPVQLPELNGSIEEIVLAGLSIIKGTDVLMLYVYKLDYLQYPYVIVGDDYPRSMEDEDHYYFIIPSEFVTSPEFIKDNPPVTKVLDGGNLYWHMRQKKDIFEEIYQLIGYEDEEKRIAVRWLYLLLNTQYQTMDTIAKTTSRVFHDNRLIAHPSTKMRPFQQDYRQRTARLEFFDESTRSFRIRSNKYILKVMEGFEVAHKSTHNKKEAQVVSALVRGLAAIGINQSKIIVLTPIKAQVTILKELAAEEGWEAPIKTIDPSQGKNSAANSLLVYWSK
ncbi:MAG: hypothetical protein M1819_000938 [Sarea resinae]|nr:MAG: hypothetical protein M1819_000938 [Sarea resinae]